jgi:hypothetical protein
VIGWKIGSFMDVWASVCLASWKYASIVGNMGTKLEIWALSWKYILKVGNKYSKVGYKFLKLEISIQKLDINS